MNKRIAITSGDFNGIGPEIILKTLQEYSFEKITPIILSSKTVLSYYLRQLGDEISYHYASKPEYIRDGELNLLHSYGDEDPTPEPGNMSVQTGRCAMKAVEQGITLCQQNKAHALVTAPISKEAVNLAGYDIPGHTEFLAEKTGPDNFMMMLVNDSLRVGLVTIHIPVAEIAKQINQPTVRKYAEIMHQSLQQDFNIPKPRIAVLGLNPHAGDGGVIGMEEIDILTPVINELQGKGFNVSGPYPADGFFGTRQYINYDGILAMYHDQGLIPFKTLSFGKGVNFTVGLPIIRTSPDHGTAFDIAGKNKADPSSFKQAFDLAIQLAENKYKNEI